VVLLAGSGLLARTVRRLSEVRPGFDPEGTLAFTVSLPRARYARSANVARFYDETLTRLAAIPGVADAGVVSHLPLSGPEALAPVFVEDAPPAPNTVPPVYPFTMASAGYFRAMHIALLAGRLFTDASDPTDANAVIVSRALAEKYWHDPTGRAAIGQRVRVLANRWSPIVGVVESVRDTSLEAAAVGQAYLPLSIAASTVPDSIAPFTPPVASFVLRTRELGLRLALGAAPLGVLGLVLREGMLLALIGVAAGLATFAGVARFLAGFLFGVGPADPLTLSVVACTLLAVAGVASAVPAWRASRIDPLDALRAE
jgi:putative ABC transport system permease protein